MSSPAQDLPIRTFRAGEVRVEVHAGPEALQRAVRRAVAGELSARLKGRDRIRLTAAAELVSRLREEAGIAWGRVEIVEPPRAPIDIVCVDVVGGARAALFSAAGSGSAAAVKEMLGDSASALRTHPAARLFLDEGSARLIDTAIAKG